MHRHACLLGGELGEAGGSAAAKSSPTPAPPAPASRLCALDTGNGNADSAGYVDGVFDANDAASTAGFVICARR